MAGGMSGARYSVAVRALCEFSAREGDLDLRYFPSPSAQEGIAGHAQVTARRGAGYQREVSLEGEFGALHVRGRADGYDPERRQLEEIKTHRGDLDALPANARQLHWAQLKIYGHLLCRKLELAELRLALVYFDIDSRQETVLHEDAGADTLRQFFELQCTRFLAWAEQEMAQRAERDAQLSTLPFPHPSFRPGQRELAEAMYKSANRGCALLAQAPTGIGKTVGSLFPLLKASAKHGIDKVFFLTAKTPGRQLALDACALIRSSAPALPLRVLELEAKTSACEHPDNACHGASCPLAAGFYDRLPAARAAAVAAMRPAGDTADTEAPPCGLLDRAALREVALAHQVCPYYLGAEMARWCDVVVGDYNYYFDTSAMLYALTLANDWRVSVLVDEAHNLVARGRQMYSAELPQGELAALRKSAPAALKKPLDRLNRQWNKLAKDLPGEYRVHPELPDKFMAALQDASAAMGDHLAAYPAAADDALQRFHFDALHFARLADSFGAHSLFDVSASAGGARLCIRNIVPAPFLRIRFEAAHSCALFSATLSPWHYYSDLLGMPDDTAWVEVASPFGAEQLSVRLAGHISTRYTQRRRSLEPIADLIARQYATQPGNYLAFFSSFDYMEQAADTLAARHPEINQWRQARRMGGDERAQFLARFTPENSGVGFAVLGGAFGEGIDLPGARLIGAFIATLGLPQMNPVNEQIRLRMQAQFGAGYDYAYLYPGIQKVVQAAGRVIRTPDDRGVVYLIDERYASLQVSELLPPWWRAGKLSDAADAPAAHPVPAPSH
jgi:DNA excision repair protein ERCC-2